MKIKKIVVALFSAALLLTPIKVYGEEKVNRFDSWKASAIISPEKGELKTAGPIEVKFYSLNLENIIVDHYDLYLDGCDEPVDIVKGNDEILSGKVYTTEVAVHTLQVVAITDGDYEISSNARKFSVSKKGLNVDDKNVKTEIEDMNESWYYNWGTNESNHVLGNKEFVPMVWNQQNLSWLQSEDAKNYSSVLGFNEPDLNSQANISEEKAAEYQSQFTNSGLRVGSAVVSYPTIQWYQNYMNYIDRDDIDFIPLHIYYDWAGEGMAQQFLKTVDEIYERYKKPIWITEFGLSNTGLYGANCSDEYKEQIKQYMKDTIQGLEEREYVERYTWFNFGLNSEAGGKTALYSQQSGELTELGELYASLGNPNIDGVNLADEYVEDDAYYKDLDNMIAEVDKVVGNPEYQDQITETLKNLLNDTKNIDRTLGSTNQYIIDQLTEDLKNEYSKIDLNQTKDIFVEENKVDNSSEVVTGDEMHIMNYLLLFIISLSGLLFYKKKIL